MSKKLKINSGDVFGYLTIIKEVERKHKNKRRFLCLCNYNNCGNEVEVNLKELSNGDTKSCGCLNKHLFYNLTTKHNLYGHPIYIKWNHLKDRCLNKNGQDYKYYGERGVYVCDEWKDDFLSFYSWAINNGWEDGLEIDRIDNDGPYSPSNCRFVTRQENSINKRLIQKNNKSGFCGVILNKTSSPENPKYCVQVRYKNKNILNKYGFSSPIAAAIARDIFIIENNLPHKLNLTYIEPNIGSENGWINN